MFFNKWHITLSIATLVLLTGCAKTAPALYPEKPIPQEVVQVEPMNFLEKASDKRNTFQLVYEPHNSQPSMDDYVNSRNSSIDLNKSPTIVIALPVQDKAVDENKERWKRNMLERMAITGNISGEQALNTAMQNSSEQTSTKTLETEGYTFKYEPNVEKELMRFGFSVLDRSKFEAKLRTLRDGGRDKYYNYYKNFDGDLYNEQLKMLKKRYEKDDLTHEEYSKQLAQLNQDKESMSRKKGEKEIVDMSELIRAAQSKGVQADYILQINEATQDPGFIVKLPVKGKSEIKDYLIDNQDLMFGYNQNKLPPEFEIEAYQVSFSAKLINVQSGKVVWTGTHELTSLNVEKILLEFDISRKDISTNNINQNISLLNDEITTTQEIASKTHLRLNQLYEKASKERKYKDEETKNYKEQSLKSTISNLENSLTKLNNKLKMLNSQKSELNTSIKHQYFLSELMVKPNLAYNPNLNRTQKKVLDNHRQKLLNMTIRSLFNTIQIQ